MALAAGGGLRDIEVGKDVNQVLPANVGGVWVANDALMDV
jgi:hypothetical protein